MAGLGLSMSSLPELPFIHYFLEWSQFRGTRYGLIGGGGALKVFGRKQSLADHQPSVGNLYC
jgi:hypothetical protein